MVQLGKKEIHIWKIDCLQFEYYVDHFYQILDSEETEKAEKFYFTVDKMDYILYHGACRLILSQYLEVSPEKIRFQTDAYGKPIIQYPSGHLHFNLTHSERLGMIAVAHRKVGIDIERIDLKLDYSNLTSHLMSPLEEKNFQALHTNQKIRAFYTCWTRKEAYVKAIGKGLSYPITQVTVSLHRSEPVILEDKVNPSEPQKWEICHLTCPSDYQGSLVYERGEADLSYYDFTQKKLAIG